jgi:hypothetical protein
LHLFNKIITVTAGIQVLIACASPLPLLDPRRYKEKMAIPEQKAFCVLQIAKHESVVSVQWAFWPQFQSDPACVRRKCGTSGTVFSSQFEEIRAPCES